MKQEGEWGPEGGRGEGGRWCRDTWRVRERKRKTGRDNSSLGNPGSAPFHPLLVPSMDCAALGLGLRSGEATHGEDWGNRDASGNQPNQGLSLFLCSGCTLVGRPEWDSRVQRKRVCFSHLIYLFPKASQSLALELSMNSACTALSPTWVDFRFELLQAWVILITVGGWVSLALFYIHNLILEIGTPRAGKVKWPAQDHTESCGREATSTTLSP